MRFEAIGDMPAPSYFDINEETGAISVKADLKTDDEIEYKVMLHQPMITPISLIIGRLFYLLSVCVCLVWSLSTSTSICKDTCLRTHDTFIQKMTANDTFVQFLRYHILTSQDRPNKYIYPGSLNESLNHFTIFL